jgi:murein DD-endopeptidase MepM/ murein hydrolase activator NlpD
MCNPPRYGLSSIMARVIVTVVALLLPVSLSAAPAAAADERAVQSAIERDAAVQGARAERDAATAYERTVSNALDQAAADYEIARGQAEHLADEARLAGVTLESQAQATQVERRSKLDLAIAAYLEPARQLTMADMILGADDASSALHLAGLMEHIGRRSDRSIERLYKTQVLRYDETRQQQVVTVGAKAAAEQQQRAADTIQAALQEATNVVRTAERTVASAETAAESRERERQRQEAERKREEDARRARDEAERRAKELQAGFSSAPAPPVAGRVCPIGIPNGFIDSWGFPRSGGRTHKGIDIFAAQSTPQFAVANGSVSTGSNRLGGLTIWLTDNVGDRYYYAHLASIDVADGAQVRAGQVIGTTGRTGNAATTPPHLHWEYHPGGGAAVNPYPLAMALCR